jgi:thiol:disulfide interchange protein
MIMGFGGLAVGSWLIVVLSFGCREERVKHLPWLTDEKVAYERARAEGKGVMIEFSAVWCQPCEELELTFSNPEVYKAITASFIPLKFDVSDGDEQDHERKNRYNAVTLPAVVFVDVEGRRLAHVQTLLAPDEMLAVVRPAAQKLNK